MSDPTATASNTPATQPGLAKARRRALTVAAAVLVIGGVIYGLYWVLAGSREVATDNAYVGADLAQVTPLTSGAVKQVLARETQSVKAGDVLVVLDDADARLQVGSAAADLGKAIRRVEQYLATDKSLSAQLAARKSDIARAEAQLNQAQSASHRAELDLARRDKVAATGAVSQEELSTSRDLATSASASLASAQASLAQAEQNRSAAEAQALANHVLVQGVDIDSNPEVLGAKAKLDQAKLDLARTVIRAPVDGVVSKRQVQIGQKVQNGATLMSIVPLKDVFVDANFKEVQLKKVRVGQSVELISDLYGDRVRYHGKVIGFSGGTGSAFAVIPAQNATGNWIKIVQRLAVRIAVNPQDLARHPLRVGLSMNVRIHTDTGE